MNYKTIAMVFISFMLVIGSLYAINTHRNSNLQKAADAIVIDSMKVFGELERPGVTFLHDKHTEALEKQGKDCKTCHQSSDDQLVYKFMRIADDDKETTLDAYHSACIGCHEDTAAADLESGPLECGECHDKTPMEVASRQMISFDQSLHYRHIQAENNNCQSCHHGYNPLAKKIEYTKGEEQSCRNCHKDEDVDQTISYQTAAHQSCISCHQDTLENKQEMKLSLTSVQCSSCHDEGKIKTIAKLDSVPRLDRNQPDTTFVKSFDKDLNSLTNPVPFNHKSHEASVENCSTCHHENMDSCESCHSITGTEQGNWITLAQAMHRSDSEKSCVGCHAVEQQQEDCKGCHALIETKSFHADPESCSSCHSTPIEKVMAAKRKGLEITPHLFPVEARTSKSVDLNSLPENVVIDALSDKYAGAHFPHRLIIESLMARIEDSALAANFHQGEEVICQSCHHNGQGSFTPPPRCVSCHSSGPEEKNEAIPGAKAAYHRQCFECHDAMKITEPASTDCVACHAEK